MAESVYPSQGKDLWSSGNPFNVTKATDLTDQEIQRMWVDLAADGGYMSVIDPRLPMPRMLLGGKGTGRTHLMRFLSAPVQRVRNSESPHSGPLTEGYLGIYLRCTGLNAGRFQGKGISNDTWQDVFTYSMDLSLTRVALDTALASFGDLEGFELAQPSMAEELKDVFDDYGYPDPKDLTEVRQHLRKMQAEIDLAVNNAAITRNLDSVRIRVSRGRLPFELPKIAQRHVEQLSTLRWLYLIDELENLTEDQQKYIQTLIREREEPASLIVGARTYGFRTQETLSAGEENKAGSEFDPVELDHLYLEHHAQFSTFCKKIIATRLIDSGYKHIDPDRLKELFFEYPTDGAGKDEEVRFVAEQGESQRRYLRRLHQQLVQYRKISDAEAEEIVSRLACDEHPLIERLNVMQLYRKWTKLDLLREAQSIGAESRAFLDGQTAPDYKQAYGHWATDVLARLLQEYQEKQRYLGLDAFIDMAGGLPRNLLIVLKNVVRAAEFNGETPFRDKPISEESQRAGVSRAAEWFYRDARAMGDAGVKSEKAIKRLGDLLRALRFADKPPEVSLSTISLARGGLDNNGKAALDTASGWSLLVKVPAGQRDKNTSAVKDKYQLNPMLCPRWDLPIHRRGTLDLSDQAAQLIFGDCSDDEFAKMRKARVDRATVPFGVDAGANTQGTLEVDEH